MVSACKSGNLFTLSTSPTHLLLSAEDSEIELISELNQCFGGVQIEPIRSLLLKTEFEITEGRRLPLLAFSRQLLPFARAIAAESVRAWAAALYRALAGILPDDKPWSLHIEPHYSAKSIPRMGARAWHSASRARHEKGRMQSAVQPTDPAPRTVSAEAGKNRCRLIRQALIDLLEKKRRHLLRHLRNAPGRFTSEDTLVQLLLTSPDSGFISVSPAPMPFEQRHLLCSFPKGEVASASDKAAPSRAFAKLVEAELRLGYAVRAGEQCVDLGASPGSWTYVAVNRGARVVAVDRSALREDLMRHRLVEFQRGDAFRFQPRQPVDWLLCDVIAPAENTAELLLNWLRHAWCRRFVVTLKVKDSTQSWVLAKLKRDLAPLTSELFLTRLCANKKEVSAFGVGLSLR
jgi:23S rRNA (cytidine2498-2'-O)-methyltransferase